MAIQNVAGALLEQLNEFRRNEQFTDVWLICDEVRIPAHKNILAAASPYFLAMFNGNFPESTQSEIHLHDMNADSLEFAIDFIYGSDNSSAPEQLGINHTNVQDLLITASFLQLERLIDICAEYMANHLDADNCLGFKHFAEKQNNLLLLESAQNYIMTHFKDIVQSAEFFEMSYAEITAILSKDELYMHSDDAVLSGLIHWVEYKPQERLKHLTELLRFIHPACVSPELARTQALLQHDDESRQWLDAVLNCEGKIDWYLFLLDKMGREPELQRFDMNFEEMVQLKPLPRPAFALSLVAYKNILYVQGGSSNGRSKRDSYYYNIYRNQWHNLHPLLMERAHHRSLIVNETIYTLGGKNLQSVTSWVECLNLVTNQANFCANMLAKRASLGAVVCDNVLYAMGGDTEHSSLYSMERYDPRLGHWHEMPSMREVNSYCTSAFIAPYHIYCCEGLGSYMERFDLRANKWETINFSEQCEFYEILAIDNKLFSIYGNAVSQYDLETNKWLSVYKFEVEREWDTAAGIQMTNYADF